MIKEILPRIYLQTVSLYREASRNTFFSQDRTFTWWITAAVGRWTPGPLILASSSVQRDEKFKQMVIILCYPQILANMNNSLMETWTWKHQCFKMQLLLPPKPPADKLVEEVNCGFLLIRLEISKDAAFTMSPQSEEKKKWIDLKIKVVKIPSRLFLRDIN